MVAQRKPKRRTVAPIGRRAVAAIIVCSALLLAFIPAAIAKRDHETSSSTTSSGQTSTQTTASTTPPSTTTTTTTEAPATPPAKKHDASGQARRAASVPAPASSASGAQQPASTGQQTQAHAAHHDGSAHEGHAAHAKRSRADAAAGAASTGEAESEPLGESQLAVSSAVEPQGKKSSGKEKSSGKGHGKGGGGKHGKGKSGKESGKETEKESEAGKESAKESELHEEATGGQGPVLSTSPPAEALAPVAATGAGASVPAPPTASAGVATPVHVAHRARAVRSGRRRHRPRAAAADPASALRGAAALPLAGGPLAARATRKTRRPHGAPRGGGNGPVAPLVRSITKIVDVVPTSVRLLIAGLLALALALAARSRVAAVRARRLERQRLELLDDVGLLQAALLPATPDRIGPVDTSAAYEPAAGPGAGGDFYDLFALADGQLAVIVGDISGHGRQALPHTALVRFTLRAYLEAGLSPRDALQTAGAVLERQLGGVFATVVVAVYQPQERVLVYSCAGHPPPLIVGAQPEARSLAPVTICTSPPLGVGMRTGTRQTTVLLPGRAQVCFYTDGVTEARVGSELYGAARLEDALCGLGPQGSAGALLAAVAEQADARPDDMAACLLSVAGGEEAPRVLAEELELDRAHAASTRTASFLRACGVANDAGAEALRSASAAAGRAGTVVLEVRNNGYEPEVVLRREQLTHLHARRAGDEHDGEAEVAR